MNELFNLVNELRNRIERYRELLSANEALTRYVLIDPTLRVLGWDTENPDIVRPEEKQDGGIPDYVLYHNGKKLIALEAKSLGTKLDEKKVLDYGFNYSWKSKIPYFIITDGNIWKVYDVREMGGNLILEINLLEDPIEECVRKLLSLWRPLIKYEIKPIETIVEVGSQPPKKAFKPEIKAEKYSEEKELDLDKVRKFYESLKDKEKEFIKIVFEAWKQGRKLSKDDIISELKRRGISVDKRGFTGVKSGITRLSKKINLPSPMPTEEELGKEYWRNETKRYILKDGWGRALEKIIG